MPLDLDAVGQSTDPVDVSWNKTDTLLYAVAVGAGQEPSRELEFTTENSIGVTQRALPTFGLVRTEQVPSPDIGDFDRSKLVHAEQRFELLRPLPLEGTLRVTATVESILDKGSGALVWTRRHAVDPVDGESVLVSRSAVFIRGEGGFGGDRGTTEEWVRPTMPPEHITVLRTRTEQALLYRLTGDRNPLHSDPVFAARGGFDQPILHGMCTYGFTCRALMAVVDDSRSELVGMSGRFTAPVVPGDELTVEVWEAEGELLFRTRRTDGTVVIDRGRGRLRSRETWVNRERKLPV